MLIVIVPFLVTFFFKNLQNQNLNLVLICKIETVDYFVKLHFTSGRIAAKNSTGKHVACDEKVHSRMFIPSCRIRSSQQKSGLTVLGSILFAFGAAASSKHYDFLMLFSVSRMYFRALIFFESVVFLFHGLAVAETHEKETHENGK